MRTLIVAALVSASALAACSSDSSSSGSSGTSSSSSSSSSSSGGTTGASFNKDVFPIFVKSCALTACHGSKQSNLGIYLPNEITIAYAELQKSSPTQNKPFVVPGNADSSYLMQKIDGKQCASCGEQMPQDAPLPQAQRDTIRAWINAGAKND